MAAAQEAIEDAEYASSDDDNDTAKELAKLYRQRNNATVKAEQDGIVTQLNTSVGSTPEGALMRIEDDTALTIQVGVKTKDIVRLEKGMRAELTTDAYPDKTFSGTVTKVVNFTSSDAGMAGGENGDTGDGYRANITIDEGDGLLLGMGVKVKIFLQEGEEAMAVPYDSIFEEDGTSYVYRAVPDEKDPETATFEKVRVNPGEPGDYYTSGRVLRVGWRELHGGRNGMTTPVKRPVILMRDIVKTYYIGQPNELEILHGIDLTVQTGEFLSIVGESGSGKSTLMNVIGALDRPTSGTYELDGEEVDSLDDATLSRIRNKKIGFVFQSFNLIPRVSALENVEVPLLYAGVPSKERRARAMDLLTMVGMEDRADHQPNELSGGQNQRVAIARAMANDPAILLADEPTGALDSETSHLVMDLFHQLHEERGKTIVLITHSNELAAETERIVKLSDGRIVADSGSRSREGVRT